MTRTTFVEKNWLRRQLTLKNLQIHCKRSIEGPLREYKKSIFDRYKWYITHMVQLTINYFQWRVMLQFIRGTYVFSVFKSVNNLNPHFMWDFFKINFFPYDLRKGNTLYFSSAWSDWVNVIRGIPQGFIFGPLLSIFLLMTFFLSLKIQTFVILQMITLCIPMTAS